VPLGAPEVGGTPAEKLQQPFDQGGRRNPPCHPPAANRESAYGISCQPARATSRMVEAVCIATKAEGRGFSAPLSVNLNAPQTASGSYFYNPHRPFAPCAAPQGCAGQATSPHPHRPPAALVYGPQVPQRWLRLSPYKRRARWQCGSSKGICSWHNLPATVLAVGVDRHITARGVQPAG
jgi:hypothetical protein